jgi:hypothetical protein
MSLKCCLELCESYTDNVNAPFALSAPRDSPVCLFFSPEYLQSLAALRLAKAVLFPRDASRRISTQILSDSRLVLGFILQLRQYLGCDSFGGKDISPRSCVASFSREEDLSQHPRTTDDSPSRKDNLYLGIEASVPEFFEVSISIEMHDGGCQNAACQTPQ